MQAHLSDLALTCPLPSALCLASAFVFRADFPSYFRPGLCLLPSVQCTQSLLTLLTQTSDASSVNRVVSPVPDSALRPTLSPDPMTPHCPGSLSPVYLFSLPHQCTCFPHPYLHLSLSFIFPPSFFLPPSFLLASLTLFLYPKERLVSPQALCSALSPLFSVLNTFPRAKIQTDSNPFQSSSILPTLNFLLDTRGP